MALPELVRRTAEKVFSEFCAGIHPPCACGEARLRFEMEEEEVTLLEDHFPCESHRHTVRAIARFRYSSALGQWTLHYPGPGRQWVFYLNANPTLDLKKLLDHLEKDPLGIFWS